MIGLNITALTTLLKAALVSFKAKGSGSVVNIGWGAGFAHGATKAYV